MGLKKLTRVMAGQAKPMIPPPASPSAPGTMIPPPGIMGSTEPMIPPPASPDVPVILRHRDRLWNEKMQALTEDVGWVC